MAKVHVVNVVVLDNPSSFNNPFQFEITFECIEDLQEDLEWKIIYVGSAESEEYDQTLDSVFVGPVPEGRHMFVFEADPPDQSKIPVQDAVGVTVVLLTCSYRGKEFIRVGYYVNNSYTDPELVENPPSVPQYDKLQRNILATNPRVTRFKIEWDDQQGRHEGAGPSGDSNVAEESSTASSSGLIAGTVAGNQNGKSHSLPATSTQDQNLDHNNHVYGDHSRDSSNHHRSNDNHSNSQPQAMEV
jgi:histone chaperone ASF1